MRELRKIPTCLYLFISLLLSVGTLKGQSVDISDFLEKKQAFDERLIVIYAPESMQNLLREQLNLMYPEVYKFSYDKIKIVQIPSVLTVQNEYYLKKKFKVQKDRLNIWVIDEKGALRMYSTKLTPVSQFLRVLNSASRPEAVARAHFLLE
jgi:hypothetical protein